MAGALYQPSEDEIAEVDEWMHTAYDEQGYLTADDVRFIAERFLPGRRVNLRAPSLGVTEWVEVHPQPKPDTPRQRPTAAPQATSQPQPPQPPAAHPNPAVEQARRNFQGVYGNEQGVKVITVAEGYDQSGRVVDVHLNPQSGRGDGLDDEARRAIAALPRYGEPGYVESKRKLAQIRTAAARRQAAATGQQAAPGQAERAAERQALAGLDDGSGTLTWDHVRRAGGSQLVYEAHRAEAKRWTPKL